MIDVSLPVGPEEPGLLGLTPHPIAGRRTEAIPKDSKRGNDFMGFSFRDNRFAAVWRRQEYTPAASTPTRVDECFLELKRSSLALANVKRGFAATSFDRGCKLGHCLNPGNWALRVR
jgi:hypothetical protein